MSALTETEINIRKQTLDAELAQHKSALNELEQKKTNITAQIYAVSGAIQQCDLFLQQLNDGNDKNVTSSIPSASKKKKGANDVAAAVMS
jgi:prephenate dehydratase|tara:strand:- start:2259 stop:2528 length:270 start_codon:yes stop_codon:yes gene_type:complete